MAHPRIRFLLALVAVAGALVGCYVPDPVAHTTLRIAADGVYTLNGEPVSRQALEARIGAAKPAGGTLVLQIEAVPTARVADIRAAVDAATAAQVRVAFVGDVRHP